MTTREQFLSAVLPPLLEGEHYCNFGNSKERIRQRFANSIEQLSTQSDELQAAGFNSFFALAKFGPKENGRYAANALALKSFFIDLDCGEGKPYPTLDDGIDALKQFCKATGLPKPTIIRSGRGAHVYWALEKPMLRQQWKPHAEKLKKLCIEHNFQIDHAVPADPARVLRMVGSNHVKDPDNPIPVEVLYFAPVVENERMEKLLDPEQDILSGLDRKDFTRPMDAVTLALMGASESKFKTLLVKSVQGDGCAQIAYIYDNQETIPEPLWRAGLSIAQQCSDRGKAIHVISKKHPDYNPEQTDRKANETKGPYTCETFKKLNPATCEGCKHKLTSPIQLGREIMEATEADNVVHDLQTILPGVKEVKTYVIPKYPFPFFRGKAGGIFVHTKNKEGEDIDDIVYPYDFYVVKRMKDPDIGETLQLRLHLPKDGVRDFILPLATVLSKERFISAVAEHGMAVLGKKQDQLMSYVVKWVEDLQMKTVAEKAYKQFGWTDDDSGIIIGDREVRATEVVYSPPSGPTLPHIPLFQPKGDFAVWKDIINTYGREGMEDRAFAFFMGFGSLLMKFTPLDGFLLNLVSTKSGSGKTTLLQAINSIYGRPKELMLDPKDTYNARMQRLGTMQNFVVTMDEITNMDPEHLSQQVYDVTSGRGKNRLRQHDNAERVNNTRWATGMITSSNRYVTDALLSIKAMPDGELKRIMEIAMKSDVNDDPVWARNHFSRLMGNYGHAIEIYAKHLIQELPEARKKLQEMQERVDAAGAIKNSERYWAGMVSLSITGGALAKHWGLHDIPIKPVFEFGMNLIASSRERSSKYTFDSDEFVGGFMGRHHNDVLIINGNKDTRTDLLSGPIREPRGQLMARYEPDTKMLYINVRSFRDDCAKVMASFEEVTQEYKKNNALLGIKKKRMAAGTVANTEAAVNVLCFDTRKLPHFNEDLLLTKNANTGDTDTD